MKKQTGFIGWMVLGIVGFAAFGLIMSYVSWANYGTRTENELAAVYENNKNVLGQYTLKVQEAASVPEMYKNDLTEVMTKTLSAKYGAEGNKAVFAWLKDANVPFDSTMYTKIQQIIEAGRNEFQTEQTRLIDVKRGYQNNLGYVVSGFFLNLAGFPKTDLNKYNIVVAADTQQVFKDGVQAPIKLR